jgi:glutathione S-transferase
MHSLHLVSHHLCPYVQRAVIVLAEKDIAHQRTYIDLGNKPDWFRAKSPLGRVPLLEVEDQVLFESQVIVEYLDEVTTGSLHPLDSLEKARHRAWIEFGSETLKTIGAFYSAVDKATYLEKKDTLTQKFSVINSHVNGPFFSGDSFHVVDAVWATIFRYFDVFDQLLDHKILDGLDPIQQWRDVLAKRRSVIDAVPAGYPDRLKIFLRNKNSYMSELMPPIN